MKSEATIYEMFVHIKNFRFFKIHRSRFLRPNVEIVSVKKHITPLKSDNTKTKEKHPDFILVYNQEAISVNSLQKVDTFLSNLEQQGFQVERTPYSNNADEIFVLLHLPNEAALRFAKILGIDLAFQTSVYMPRRLPRFNFIKTDITAPLPQSPIALRAKENITSYIPKNITSAEKNLIIYKLLEKNAYGPMRNEYGIVKLLHKKAFTEAFPLHDGPPEWTNEGQLNDRQLLRRYWSNLYCWYKIQPIDLIEKYFGPEVAFYFAWLGFYNKMLVFAAIGGILSLIIGVISFPDTSRTEEICNSDKVLCPRCLQPHCKYEILKSACADVKRTQIFDNPMTITYAAIMSIWATLFLEFWRREQATLQIRWNLKGVETDLSMRPEFEETTKWSRISEITKTFELYVPKRILFVRYVLSASSMLLLIFLMIMAIFGVMVYVKTISVVMAKSVNTKNLESNVDTLASTSGSLISVIFMVIFEMIYSKVAFWLTQFENPRTQIEFDNSYTYKTFAMEFVNCYAAVFYIAFLKARFYTYPGDSYLWTTFGGIRSDICNASGCMNELGTQLYMILVIRNLVSTAKQYITPKILLLWKKIRIRHTKNVEEEIKFERQWEEDYNLNVYQKYHLIAEYKQMVIQYGFVTFFVAAFPLAPVIALINNMVEMRLDAYKLTNMYKRPVAFKVANLGAWNGILEAMTYISIATNAFVISFTSEFIPREIYRHTKNSTLAGFSDFLLSEFNTSDFHFTPDMNYSICYYPGYRYPPNHKNKYSRDDDYWYLWAMQLLGVVIFEHALVVINGFVAYLVPDIPFSVKQQINYEKETMSEIRRRALTDKYLKENKPQTKDILENVSLDKD